MMKEQLKRRLTGAIVLVSLAVIFVPMLLDGRSVDQQLEAGIPLRDTGPFDEQLAEARPEPIVPITGELASRDISPAADVAQVVAPVAPPPRVQPQPAAAPQPVAATLQGWVIQVASFSKQDNADEVAGKLRSAGFDTRIEQAQVKGQTVYRVQVGPEADKARAEALLQRIRSTVQLKGKLLAYPSA
jgi:DedD protein